jgi:acyl-CoA dehydrogenase family protein 9
MAVELFASACVIARTQSLIEELRAEACEREMRLCQLFCVESGKRFRASRIALGAAEDDMRRGVAADVRAAGGYFVRDAIMD